MRDAGFGGDVVEAGGGEPGAGEGAGGCVEDLLAPFGARQPPDWRVVPRPVPSRCHRNLLLFKTDYTSNLV